MDESTTLNDLKKKVADFRDKRDWKKFHTPKDLSSAIAIEASELQELFLWKSQEETENFLKNPDNLKKTKEEMADVALFLLSMADILNVDLDEAIADKLKKNDEKYPVGKSKGMAKKYTEL